MAFDVYVGTMSRFYRRDWENVAQRMAREQGTRYTMIYAGGEPDPPPSAAEMREVVAAWCDALNRVLEPHVAGPIAWDESDGMQYFTDRPSWEGYAALLVWAAHAEHPDLPLPAEVPRSWADDPAYERSTGEGFKSRYRSILEPDLWLPKEFPFVFQGPTIVAEKSWIGSVFTLKQQLDLLYQETEERLKQLKQAPEIEIPKLDAPSTERAGFFGRLFARRPPRPEPERARLADAAEFGLAVFRDLAAKACEHRLPMLLSY